MGTASISETGLVRSQNEDALHIDERRGLYMVADGLGGHQRGDVASALAIRVVRRELSRRLDAGAPPEAAIREAMQTANQAVHDRACRSDALRGMGTTLSLVLLAEEGLYYGHIGDSRICLEQNGSCRQLTRDHTMVEELRETGTISSEEARQHPRKHVLVKALGTQPSVDPDIGYERLDETEHIALMTDGIYEYVDASSLGTILHEMSPQRAVTQIAGRIRDAGAKDNFTLIIVEREGRTNE